MANHDDLHITLTLLIGVAVTCGALYWSARNASPAPRGLVRPPLAVAPPVVVPVARPAPRPGVAPGDDGPREHPPPGNRAQDVPASDYDGPELPIVFAFSERSVYTTEEGADGKMTNVAKRVKEGIISNTSDKPLTITATEVNIPTQETSQTQFVLGGGMQKHFGSDQGLKMDSGDQVTLRSPAYRESVQLIP